MSTELSTPEKPEHGTFRKVTEVSLGVLSAASLAMNFIPGLNLIGAATQAGVTVVETGLNIADKNYKKAALTFVTGTIFTALGLIPEVEGVVRLAAEGADAAGTAAKGAGVFSKIGAAFASASKWMKDSIKAIPGVTKVHGSLLGAEAKLGDFASKSKMYRDSVEFLKTHNTARKAIKGGLFVGGMGLSIVGDAPPANLLDRETYPHSHPKAAPQAEQTEMNEAATGGHAAKMRARQEQARAAATHRA